MNATTINRPLEWQLEGKAMKIELPETTPHECTGDAMRCHDGHGCECAMAGNAPPQVRYTAEQMRSYGEACAKAEREACAKVCDEIAGHLDNAHNRALGMAGDLRETAMDCAAEIRAR